MKKFICCLILTSALLLGYSTSMAEDDLNSSSDGSEQWTYTIQAGSFSSEIEAKELISKLTYLKFPVKYEIYKEKRHRVLIGPYPDNKTMFEAQKKLSANGFESLRMRRKAERENS